MQVKSGIIYEGLLYAVNTSGKELDVVLLLAKQVQDAADSTPVVQRLKVLHSDIVHITAKQVKLTEKDWAADTPGTEAFGTDAEIGAKAKAYALSL